MRDRQVGELSGGQKERAFVARALAQGAELLFLDEPCAGVDKRSEKTITDLLRTVAAEGRTIVVSTHDLIAVRALCDRVTLINRRIIGTGPGRDARARAPGRAFGGFVPQEALVGPSGCRSPRRLEGRRATGLADDQSRSDMDARC